MSSIRTRSALRGLALAAALFCPILAQALSVGEISLQSRLGEPLRATISLGKLGSLSQDQVIVGRASEETYRTYGVDRAFYNSPLRFELQIDARGEASVLVSSEQPLAEPFIDMVVEVKWPSGRSVKQFTLLLDPPSR